MRCTFNCKFIKIPIENFTKLDFIKVDNECYNFECVIRVVALSGGYTTDKACELLKKNKKMIASFSRALVQNIYSYQTDDEFDKVLLDSIKQIYDASV